MPGCHRLLTHNLHITRPLALRILSGLDVLVDMQSQNLTASCSIPYWRLLTKEKKAYLEGAQLRLI